MKGWGLGMLCGLLLATAGCQAVEDYQAGKAAIQSDAQLQQEAQSELARVQQLVALIPNGQIAWPFLAPLVIGLIRFRVGKRIHQGKTPSVKPIWGTWGQETKIEDLTHTVESFRAALFEVGADGTAGKRAYKVGVAVSLAIGAAAVFMPGFAELLQGHTMQFVIVPALAGLVAGLEKKSSEVKPVVTPAS